jgi:hypothetical protein
LKNRPYRSKTGHLVWLQEGRRDFTEIKVTNKTEHTTAPWKASDHCNNGSSHFHPHHGYPGQPSVSKTT